MRPVPPFADARVPESVIVPDVVIGPPEVVSPVEPPETFTEVTVPLPLTGCQEVFEPSVSSTLPEFPTCEGNRALRDALADV